MEIIAITEYSMLFFCYNELRLYFPHYYSCYYKFSLFIVVNAREQRLRSFVLPPKWVQFGLRNELFLLSQHSHMSFWRDPWSFAATEREEHSFWTPLLSLSLSLSLSLYHVRDRRDRKREASTLCHWRPGDKVSRESTLILWQATLFLSSSLVLLLPKERARRIARSMLGGQSVERRRVNRPFRGDQTCA